MINNIKKVLVAATMIPLLVYLLKKRNKKKALRERILADGEADYRETAKNIAESIAKAKDLYKKLIIKVHPDRFLDQRNEKATAITAQLTQARNDYKELKRIELEIEEFLANQ
jgi:hypothetical protein